MKFSFFPKTWLLQITNRKKGVISPIAIFTFLVFSILGLGMLYLSQLHLKFSAYRKNSILLDYASENGIKQGFNHLIGLLSEIKFPIVLSFDEMDKLREDAFQEGKMLIEKLEGLQAPIKNSGSWLSLIWQSRSEFFLEKIEDKGDYFKIFFKTKIQAEGRIKYFYPKRESMLENEMQLLLGTLPLPKIPFLLEKKLDSEQQKSFSKDNNIEFTPRRNNAISPQVAFSEEKLLPQEANAQLLKALKIKIFHPQNLSHHRLRLALGLEESDDPLPEGVYLIKDDLGLGGLFIQGDVEEMILAIEENFQVISFLTEKGQWILKFSPAKGKTLFLTPTESHSYNLIPLGIIIINGTIHSLGGGIVDHSGQIILMKEEIPSILQGVNLTIIASEEITISSHIIHQGLKWQEGVPYVRDSKSQLIIFASGKDFLDESEKKGEIIIDENSPEAIKIQASITASGKGISVRGEKKTVHLLGSLQASELAMNKNKFKITFDEQILEKEEALQFAPKTTKPVIHLAYFWPKEWKEY